MRGLVRGHTHARSGKEDAPPAPASGGGLLVPHAGAYAALTSVLLRGFYARVAADVAASAPRGARILEVGCGPGHLALRLADRGFDVTAVDLDAGMIARARSNAERRATRPGKRPSFLVGDAAALPIPDASFDLAVSTLSVHHWADVAAGFREMARALSPGGRALVWDLRPNVRPFPFAGRAHAHPPDPAEHARGSGLVVRQAAPWKWPLGFRIVQRVELAKAAP